MRFANKRISVHDGRKFCGKLDVFGSKHIPSDFGKKQKLLHYSFHVVRFARDAFKAFVENGRVGFTPPQQQIGVALYYRNRGLKLVTGVGHEFFLTVERLLEIIQHFIDSLGKFSQFVLRVHVVQPCGKVVAAYLVDAFYHAPYGA